MHEGNGPLEDEAIKREIHNLLEQNSGGMKFMALMPRIMMKHPGVGVQRLLNIIEDMDDVDVLEYVWKSMNRIKYFVHQK